MTSFTVEVTPTAFGAQLDAIANYTATGAGAVTRTLAAKLADIQSAADYANFAEYAAVALSGHFFTENGGIVTRVERLLVGGAVLNDGAQPNVGQDWLTQFQLAAGVSAGTLDFAQFASLNCNSTNDTAGVGVLAGVQSKYFTSSASSVLPTCSFAINNNTTYANDAWAYYGEAHKTTAASGTIIGMELDTRTLVASIAPTPNQQGSVIGLQLASGCGLSATGQFDGSAAMQVVANPMKWQCGINFLAGSLTSGLAIALYAAASNPHRIQWFDASGFQAGSITSTATGNDANSILFSDNELFFNNADGSNAASIANVASSVNHILVSSAITGSPPILQAVGSDSNVGILLSPKGSGTVQAPIANIASYANDAGAAAGGVPVGGFYRNSSALQIRVS